MRHDQIPCHDEDYSGYCDGCSYVGEDHRRDDIVHAHRSALRAKRLQSVYSVMGCGLFMLWPIIAFVLVGYFVGRLW